MISLRYAGAAAALFVRTNALICSSSCSTTASTCAYFSSNSPQLALQHPLQQHQQQQQQQRRRRRPRSTLYRHGSSSGSSNLGSTNSNSGSGSSSYSTTGDRTIEASCPLPFTELPYRGACFTLSPSDDDDDDDDDRSIISLLSQSIPILSEHRYNSCWVRIPTARSSIVASLSSELDFELHHVDNKNDHGGTIVMKRWLRNDMEDKVPPYPNTQVGCAGLVLSDDNELLVVKEWSGAQGNRTQSQRWKLPGGLLDGGESFGEASTREVMEETGVACTYESLLTLWHRHHIPPHGISDIYVVCLLRPDGESLSSSSPSMTNDNSNKPTITIDPDEISDCKWMKVEEFLATQDHPLITRILETSFGLETRMNTMMKEGVEEEERRGDQDYYAEVVRKSSGGKRLRPRAVMEEFDIQFSSTRPVIPTYVGVSTVGVDDGDGDGGI